MPTDPLHPVLPGDELEIKAATWNAFIDAAIDFQRRRVPATRESAPTDIAARLILPVRNDSAADRVRGDVLEINAVFPTPADNPNAFATRPGLRGIAPTGDPNKPTATLLEPAADGKHARAILAGLAAGRVYVASAAEDSSHRYLFARPSPSDPTKYTLAPYGPHRILWRESGTGTKNALIIHGAGGTDGTVICTAANQIPAASSSAPGTATVQPQRIDPTTGAFTDDGPTETLYSWTTNPSAIPPSGGTIRIIAHRDHYGRLIWTGEDCP